MRITTGIFFFIFFSFQLLAQETSRLSGQVKDNKGENLPFANIALLEDETSKLITGTVTDENGKFLFQTNYTGKALLTVSSIGFETYKSETIELLETHKDFGVLEVKEEVSSLQEVTVKATRPDVIIEADKTIVNIEGTAMAEGNTALDVVGRSPGIFIDAEGNINLNGRSGVTVMIDDRPTYMSATDLANFLRSMPADNIKSIEIINSPTSKFDAEGAAGIINIKLKKNNIEGIFGNVHLGNQYNGLNAPFAGASLSVKKGKWTSNANLNHSHWAHYNELDIFRKFKLPEGRSDFDQESVIKNHYKNHFFNGVTDYEINKTHSVGLSLQASLNDGSSISNSFTNFNTPGTDQTNFIRSMNDNGSGNKRLFANLHYVGKLDTVGTKITSDIDFTRMNASSLGLLSNSIWMDEMQENAATRDYLKTDNSMYYNIFTAKVDFTKAFGKGRVLETGLKGSWMMSDNDLKLSRSATGDTYTLDPNSNAFIYNENILAAYASYKASITENLNFQAGLRAEYSDIKGNSVTLNDINTQQYVSFFPSMFVQHKVNDNYQITFSANRRISRPNYRLLNPFIFYIDPLTSEQGNPQLRPQFSNNFEINHVLKNTYQLSMGYNVINNVFQQIFEQDEASRTTTTYTTNLDKSENLNIRLMAPIEISKWWNISNMVQVNHNKFNSMIGDVLLKKQMTSYMVRTQHNWVLPKGFKIELVGMYLGPHLYGQTILKNMGWVDAGITKSFIDDKFTLTINGTDLLRTQIIRADVIFDNMDINIRQYRNNQGVRLTLRYKFSKGENFKVASRSGSSEERNRLD